MRIDSEHILSQWLVLQAQSGQGDKANEALEELLKLWYPKLLRYSVHQLKDSEDAKDTVQEALMTASRKYVRDNPSQILNRLI